jgi:hypothetical protein
MMHVLPSFLETMNYTYIRKIGLSIKRPEPTAEYSFQSRVFKVSYVLFAGLVPLAMNQSLK